MGLPSHGVGSPSLPCSTGRARGRTRLGCGVPLPRGEPAWQPPSGSHPSLLSPGCACAPVPTCLCDHDSSGTAKESCRGWTCIKVFTLHEATPWCVQPDSQGPQRSWLKAKLNPAPPLQQHCYNSKSQFHRDTSLLSKPLAATEHSGKERARVPI